MSRLRQQVQFFSLDSSDLQTLLELSPPPFALNGVYRQLKYVERYARDLGCQSLLIEEHYIDRDYMEDHSVFYSKNLHPYPNSCRRIHFFACPLAEARRRFRQLRNLADRGDFIRQAHEFSDQQYIGFSVIKPLDGCPIGRTVLRCFPEQGDRGYTRQFNCACDYSSHVLGIPLRIKGLAFQQQDVGVSACATTALWSALQRTRALEEAGAATPAQITIRASQHALPFGRSMPSEGLSIDQMCQAVHSFGFAPNLFRTDRFEVARSLLYSAVMSGISPVLILESIDRNAAHAVAVAGMKIQTKITPSTDLLADGARKMAGLYIHDDRIGPYLRAQIKKGGPGSRTAPFINIPLREDPAGETWRLTHALIPMHAKIRLSFGELQRVSLRIVDYANAFRETLLSRRPAATTWDSWISKSHEYVESLIVGSPKAPATVVEKLTESVPLPRYVAVIRVKAHDLDPIDVLLDTTSTERNLEALAVATPMNATHETKEVALCLSIQFACTSIQ